MGKLFLVISIILTLSTSAFAFECTYSKSLDYKKTLKELKKSTCNNQSSRSFEVALRTFFDKLAKTNDTAMVCEQKNCSTEELCLQLIKTNPQVQYYVSEYINLIKAGWDEKTNVAKLSPDKLKKFYDAFLTYCNSNLYGVFNLGFSCYKEATSNEKGVEKAFFNYNEQEAYNARVKAVEQALLAAEISPTSDFGKHCNTIMESKVESF